MRLDLKKLAQRAKEFQSGKTKVKYPDDFKSRCVELMDSHSAKELAEALVIHPTTLRGWKRKFLDDKRPSRGTPNFAPVAPPSENSKQVLEDPPHTHSTIHINMSYRDGRRVNMELPAIPSVTKELIGVIRQNFSCSNYGGESHASDWS